MANFMGGTTKQLEFDTKGRSRHLSSPPAIMCSIFKGVINEIRFRERDTHMLFRASAATINRVQIHLAVVGDVTANHGAL